MESLFVPTPKVINKDVIYEVTVPGSKSITNRMLLMAALSNGSCSLSGCQFSDDSSHFINCLITLGFEIVVDEEKQFVSIKGENGNIPKDYAEIYVGSAGTAARFLVAMLSMSSGKYKIDASEQMKKRPMKPLFDALVSMGASFEYLEEEFHLPVIVTGAKASAELLDEIKLTVDITSSSQFLSALLIAAPVLNKKVVIDTIGSHGMKYVDMTLKIMADFGIKNVCSESLGEGFRYVLDGNQDYLAGEYYVEPDLSAACYFYGIAAITKTKILVKGVFNNTLQGDIEFVRCLEKMGCEVCELDNGILVIGPDKLKGGFDFDFSTFSDQALTMSNVALFADDKISISNIAHIRLQESDRINAIVSNISAIGGRADCDDESVTIYPSKLNGGEINTFDDHRVAMSFSIPGLLVEGIKILDPLCCRKTFANYFDVLGSLICEMERGI